MKYEFENIPDALQRRDQWILWRREDRDGDATKVPYRADGSHASTTDPTTWTSFLAVQDAYVSGSFAGIGFVFKEDGPFVGVDLDGCVDGVDITGEALDLVERLDSYTEGSPSGTGLHVICRGFLPDLGNRSSDVDGLKELEIYDSARYFTFTGRHLGGTPKTVENRAQKVYDLCKDVFGDPESESEPTTPTRPHDLDDRQLIERAKSADNGAKFTRLWDGDTSGYKSHSEAQQALANLLAFWTGGDEARMLRLFKDSDMPRSDDDVRKFEDYDVATALDEQNEFYNPPAPEGQDESDQDNGGQNSMGPRGDGQATKEPNLDAASDPWRKIRSAYDSDKEQARLFAAKQVISDLHVATRRENGHCYVWDPAEKVLDSSGEQRIGEHLVRKLGTSHSLHEQKEITQKVRLLTAQDGFGGEFIPVANGDLFLDGDSVRLEDADPERAPLSRSEARWDPDAECTFFEGHLQGVMPDDRERETLQEYAGYCLLHWDIPFHKALFIVGPTASGKSTTLNVVQKLLGDVSKLSPQQLVNGRFGPAELEGAWANVRSDISAALLQDIGLFKEVVAGDPIYVERKYEQGYSLRPTAKHMYSANRLPDLSIDDDAFFRRILLVSFPTTIPREERVNRSELDRRLEQELDGILRWAVEGLCRVLGQEGFTHDLSPDETRSRWEEHASSIGRFKAAALNVTGDPGDTVAKERAFDAYTQFCRDHGLSTETKQQLTRTLKRDPRVSDGHRTPTGESGQVRCYIGVEVDENAL